MWSAAVFDPALPVRSFAARNSCVLSHHTPSGWNPKVRLKVGAACSFSLCATTIVASTSRTTVAPRSVPATLLAGTPPGSRDQTRRRTRALAAAIFFTRAGVTSSRARHTVGGEATGPSTAAWWRSTSMSAIASPPSASITATSLSTWPRSWTGDERAAHHRPRQLAVRPVRSASRRSPTLPAWATTPTPSAETDNPDDHDVRFTYRVLPAGRTWALASPSLPCREHFGASTRRSPRHPVNDPG